MISVFGTTFQNPILLAAGTAGFGREVAGVTRLGSLGGLITKAVSPNPRSGNHSPRVAEFAGGMLNSVGLANPGVDHVAKVELPWLENHLDKTRLIVNVVGDAPADYVTVIRALSGHPRITGFELNVSCPNTDRGGEEFGANTTVLVALITACVGETDRPVIVKLAPTLPDIGAAADVAAQAGAAGFSVVNTIPGVLYHRVGGSAGELRPRLGAGKGGLSGPALLPVGLLATQRVHQRTGLPIIGVGGVSEPEHVFSYLEAGAALVGVGTAALADPRCPERLAEAWLAAGG